MIDAISSTFSELWNLRDPNAGENPLRARPGKRTEAIRRFLGLSGSKPAKQTVEVTKIYPKTPVNAPKDRIRTPAPPKPPKPPPAPKRPSKRLKTAHYKLKNLANEPFIKDKGVPGGWNSVLPKESPDLAQARLENKLQGTKTATRKTSHIEISGKRRQFLFLNLSDEKILQYLTGQDPAWANLFPGLLTKDKNRVYFEGLPVLLRDEKRRIIKKTYFDPSLPLSVYNIHDHLRKKYANVTRRNVTSVLRTLEVYQRMRSRQLPQKITGRVEVYSPGFLAADTIYPSTKHGWRKNTIILTVVDMWSRYTGAYLLSDKSKKTVARAFQLYIDSFLQATDSRPRKLLIDKGSELKGLDEIMEKYTDKRPCVFRSLTGQPVNIIEGLNAQIQRMAQVYREAGIVSDYGDVLYMVTNSINNQARPDRMGYSPVELMQMNAGMRQEVNSNYKFRNVMTAEQNPLEVGTLVRILMLNRKEQVDTKTKGFPAHWSKDVFQITRRTAVIKNPGVYKYWLESTTTGTMVEGSRFRHELLELKISSLQDIDKKVVKPVLKSKLKKQPRVEGTGDDALYDPADDWDDAGSD